MCTRSVIKGDGTGCSNTERISYRNQLMIASYQQMRKKYNKSGEIHTDEEDILNNNALLLEESTKPSPTTRVNQSRNQVQSKPE